MVEKASKQSAKPDTGTRQQVMDKKYVCPCGLICTDCLFHKTEIYETAGKLKDIIRDSQLDIFLKLISSDESREGIAKHLNEGPAEVKRCFDPFKKFPDFMQLLDSLIQLQCTATCRDVGGCSMGGKLHKCDAVICVEAKGYEGCWECPESGSCGKLNFVRHSYGEVIDENFKTIKDQGTAAVRSRGRKYYAWQRKINK